MTTKLGQLAGMLLLVGITAACTGERGARAATVLRSTAGSYELEILVDGQRAPQFQHNGQSYILGQKGQRYVLRVWNRSGRRAEAVVSVDGRDVMDGQTADYRTKRGYLVPAWGSVDIDGWRLSSAQAAAFRFSSVASSYAAQTGSARDVGVIGVAMFPERVVPPPVARPQVVRPERREYGQGTGSDDFGSSGGVGGLGRSRSAQPTDGASANATPPPAPRPAAPATSAPAAEAQAAPSSKAAPRGGAGRSMDSRADSEGEAAREESVATTRDAKKSAERPGLGTEFGEAVDSSVHEVSFVRANSSTPAMIFGVRYNNRAGLVALGIDVDGDGHDLSLRESADPFRGSRTYATPPANWRGR